MPRVRCTYLDCIYLDDDICTASFITIDPDSGCETYETVAPSHSDEDWEEGDELENWDSFEEDVESDENLWYGEDDY